MKSATLLFLTFLTTFSLLNAQESTVTKEALLFKCKPAINPWDPDFQQGSEVFMDVFTANDNQNLIIEVAGMAGPVTTYGEQGEIPFHIQSNFSFVSAVWDKNVMAFSYRKMPYWIGHLALNGEESKFICEEKTDITKL